MKKKLIRFMVNVLYILTFPVWVIPFVIGGLCCLAWQELSKEFFWEKKGGSGRLLGP